jgi:hypothetical protein
MKAADSVSVDGTVTAQDRITFNPLQLIKLCIARCTTAYESYIEGLTGLRLCASQLLLFIR